MQLDINRIFSDRLVFDGQLRVKNSLWDWIKRIISWIYSPASYTAENKKTIACFKKYLIDTLGEQRLQRICARYSIDLDRMRTLYSRDVAKIVVGSRDVTMADILEHGPIGSAEAFAKLQKELSTKLSYWQIPKLDFIGGHPTNFISNLIYDSFGADRERLQICEEHAKDSQEVFMHNMVARVIKREMEPGTIIPAINGRGGKPQFYYVAAKLITGDGMVSYIFQPATNDTNLEAMRLFRGTSPRNSDIDALSSMITDLEKDLGRTAFLSGQKYEETIRQRLGQVTVEGGHSLGSTIVQYRLANMDHIRRAYLFCGPGLPLPEVEKFNRKNLQASLMIRHSARDIWSTVGQAHIGYKAPENVDVDYCKNHPPFFNSGISPHVHVYGKEKDNYGIEGMTPQTRDRELYNKSNRLERFRAATGPASAKCLRAIRSLWRTCTCDRIRSETGLKIGSLRDGRWHVEHFRAI